MSVVAKIKSRIAELVAGGSTRADAMRAAALEFKQELATPVSMPTIADAAVARLDKAVAGIRARMWPDAKDDEDLSDRLRAETRKSVTNSLNPIGSSPGNSNPSGPPSNGAFPTGSVGAFARGLIERYRLKGETPEAKDQSPKPSSTLVAMMAGVYVGGSNQQNLNDEFQDDVATANWRKSTEAASKPRVSGVDEVNPLDASAVDAALRRQHLRLVK